MSFCSYSSQLIIENKTSIDNLFITSFMPYAPNECVKVYLYGLLLCNDSNETHNTLEEFSKALNISKEDVENSFLYWQEQGLVQILETIPMQIKYLPIKNSLMKHPKIKEEKYSSFNLQAQEIISDRMIMPNEYFEYYVTMESLHIEQSAFLMIMKYCTDIKGTNVGYPYILTVAKNWAKEGYTTASSVNEKLLGYEMLNEDIKLILKAMGLKRNADIDERDLYEKWKEMGFEANVIIFIVKMLKKSKKSVSFKYLDTILEKYYSIHLFSIMEIEAFEAQKQDLCVLAKNICKNIGVYYENIEPVVENYVANWKNMGYDDETLLKISNYCFKSSIRTLEYMDKQILKFYKLGITNTSSLNQYFDEVLQTEQEIKNLIEKLGLQRNVNNFDRECYRNWKNNWNISDDLIEEAINISKDKSQPMIYMNKILSSWNSNNITTVEQAKSFQLEPKQSKLKSTKTKQNFKERTYTKEEISSLFTNLEEIEI